MNTLYSFWQKTKNSALGRTLKLDHISCLTIGLWPLLWGFIAADSADTLGYILPAVAFILTLRWLFYHMIDLIPEDDISLRSHGSLLATGIGLVLTSLLAFHLGGLVVFLFIFWLVGFGIYQILYRDTWWPHISYGILFGAWPALFGHAATQDMSIGVIWPMIAGFFWVSAIEMVRSGTALDADKNEHLIIVSQIVGELKMSYSSIFLGLALAFLVVAGLFAEASGVYYVFLMLAEAVMLTSLRNAKLHPEKTALRFYTHSAYASMIVCLAFWSI